MDSTGRADYFRRFYIRRARRILPAYWATVVALVALGYFGWHDVVTAALFLSNLRSVSGIHNAYGPFWSLAVEEQFYLIWPGAVLLLKSRRALTICLLAVCITTPAARALSFTGRPYLGDVHEITWLRADNLAIGALMAVFCRSGLCTRSSMRNLALALVAVAAMFFVALTPFGLLHRDSVVGVAFQSVPWNLIFGAALLASLLTGEGLDRISSLSVLKFYGYISYGFYLIHTLFLRLYDKIMATLGVESFHGHLGLLILRLLIGLAACTGVAWLSRKYFRRMVPSNETRPS